MEKKVSPKRRPKQLQANYVEDIAQRKQKAIEKMHEELKLGQKDDMKILEDAVEAVGYHEANYAYPILLEYLKRGKLVNAQMLIINVIMTTTIDAAMLEEDENNPSLIQQLNANSDNFNKMKRLSKVLLHITEQDNHKNYFENYLEHLNTLHAKAKRKDSISEYEEWLEQGMIIFPEDIKLKNRYINFLISENRLNEAESILLNVVSKTNIYRIKEEDYIPYLSARSVLVAMEIRKQMKGETKDYALAKSIAGETLIIAPGNFDAQLHLAQISLLEGNFTEADMRAKLLSEMVAKKKYSKKEREDAEELSKQIMRGRIDRYGIPAILRQEDLKYGKHLEDSRYFQELKQVQELIYQGQLVQAKAKIDSLPINIQQDTGGRYVKMQYYIATGQYDIARNIYNTSNQNNIKRKSYGAMANLMNLKDRIQSAKGIYEKEKEEEEEK